MIIGISGKAASGKNTAATYLIKNYGGVEAAFADPLKHLARHLIVSYFGETVDPWTDKNPKVRRFLQVLGTELMRGYDADVWVKAGMKQAELLQQENRNVFITDVRFPNEADAILRRGGFVIRLDVDEKIRRKRLAALYGDAADEKANHPSETALDNYFGFVRINANGRGMYAELRGVMENRGIPFKRRQTLEGAA